jgi:hypothetical protein
MALRESIVQVVHHVHVFTQLHAQHMSVQAIAITTTMRAVSAPRVLVLLCRAILLSAHRVAIVHVATMVRVVTSSARAVTASVHRVAMVSVHRVAMVSVLSRAVTVVLSRVVMVVLSREVTVVLSRVATVVHSRAVTVVLSRAVTVVLSRVATANLTAHLLTRRVHVSTVPTTIQMQSTQ